MAVKQELEISITPEGEVKIEVKGVKGSSCLDVTKEIEEALGVVTDREHTSEYYQQEQEQQRKIKLGND